MKWHEVRMQCAVEDVDRISLAMIEKGATGTLIHDPEEVRRLLDGLAAGELADREEILEAHPSCMVTGYYSTDEDIPRLLDALEQETGNTALFREVDDGDWKDRWKEYFKPFHITDTFRILPSWSPEARNPGKNDILMDPGMAFGTGTHETTRLCAIMLEETVRKQDRVIDVGCGTAILAIIAVKAGAREAVAVDIDTAAVKAARENVAVNVRGKVSVVKGELKDITPDCQADILCANIVADVILDLAGSFGKYLKKGGKVICSGIIDGRKQEVLDAFGKNGLTVTEVRSLNGWTAIKAHA
ncbi:MAG: 50S ribosomal protein L11 methyltransferase [Clostridia bacterium]